ncbi:uncharacterized protein [Periplaneta americana]|uniref:uncharacterized protein n=1 Tax=Periplaneta americana TaxID=6978 RepID=UPI0037E71BB1
MNSGQADSNTFGTSLRVSSISILTKMRKATILLAALCVFVWSSRSEAQAPPAVCKDSSECGPNKCCLLGRYSGTEPTCQDAPRENDACRPHQVGSNTTVYGNDGKPKYTVTNVYTDVCPCGQGLDCDTNSGGLCKKTT